MQKISKEMEVHEKPMRRRIFQNVLYFGIPLLAAISSAVFPISPFLRQAMIGFIVIWFVIGSWLFNDKK
jgi:hypothetical protein